MVLISVYGTVFNNAYILRESLTTLMRSLNNRNINYEIVIVDNYSTDGTWNILKEFKYKYPEKIKILRYACSRGKGRNIALYNTSGDFVFYVDFDCIFDDLLGILIDKLQRIAVKNEIWNRGFTHRQTMIEVIGGWKNLNFGEDWEMYARAIVKGVKCKRVTILPPFTNVKYCRTKGGEHRYISNNVQYIVRRIRNIMDSIRSFRVPKTYIFHNQWRIPTKITYVFLSYHYFLNCLNDRLFCKLMDKYHNTTCFTYTNMKYILPEEIGLDSNLFFLLFENFDICFEHLKNILINLVNKDKKNIKVLLDKKRRILYLYRDKMVWLKGIYRLRGVDVEHIHYVS